MAALPDIASNGFHMPPEVLGVRTPDQETTTEQSTNKRPAANLAEVNSKSRRRSSVAIKATKSKAAIAAATRAVSDSLDPLQVALTSSMFTLLTYEGTEVVFANTSLQTIVGQHQASQGWDTANLLGQEPIQVVLVFRSRSTQKVGGTHRGELLRFHPAK